MKRSPLKRKTKLKRLTRMRKVSTRRRKEAAIYGRKRKAFLFLEPLCEVIRFPDCTGGATQVHHKAGRAGRNYLDESTWLAVCGSCHLFIHQNPNEARTLNLLK